MGFSVWASRTTSARSTGVWWRARLRPTCLGTPGKGLTLWFSRPSGFMRSFARTIRLTASARLSFCGNSTAVDRNQLQPRQKDRRDVMNRREFSQLLAATALGHSFLGADAQPMKAASEVQFCVMLWPVGECQGWSPDGVRRIRARMRSLGLVFDSMSGVAAGFADPNGTAELMRQ